ncbi:GTP cyclohydrolase I FolE [Candidatus Cyrtobacter comes]|nr:GTP cyclohydrolase I FolE [Candidatus Cyrtobacter comes]
MSVTREQAEDAVRVLLEFIGEDPNRGGLLKTPSRVVNAFSEYFSGYSQAPSEILSAKFSDAQHYDDYILLKNIKFISHCEHHMARIIGVAHVAYIPNKAIVGISKIARLVDAFAKRLQVQERMTLQIAESIEKHLDALGVAVVICAEHGCMTSRGVKKDGTIMRTQKLLGQFKNDERLMASFLASI